MSSLANQFAQMGFFQRPKSLNLYPNTLLIQASRSPSIITCGLRGGTRETLWRSRVLSTEAIQVVHSLKLARNPAKLEDVIRTRLSRLLKADLLDTLAELRRQNELELALKVFEFVRKEVWYEPDTSLFNDMILMFARNRLIEMVENLFFELKKEGLEPDTRTYTEMIGAYFKVDRIEKAMETYKLMKVSGCPPDKLTLTILIRNLEKAGQDKLASAIKKDCMERLDSPEKFLQEVEKQYPKRRSLNLV